MPWENLSCEYARSLITDIITIKVILGSSNKKIISLVIGLCSEKNIKKLQPLVLGL